MTTPEAVPAPAPVPGRAAAWRSRVPVPTMRLAVWTAVTGVALIAVPSEWAPATATALTAVLIVAAVVDTIRAGAPWSVPVARTVPTIVILGREGELSWVLRNPGRRRQQVAVAEEPAPSLQLARRRAMLVVASGATAVVASAFRPTRRGRFALDTLVVRTVGPWGLAGRQHRRVLSSQLEVHPAFRSRHEVELRLTPGRVHDVGMRAARAPGRGTRFEALREYTPDDEVRRVDWAATARVGRPIVRTYRAERNQTVMVLLDSGRLMAGVVDGAPRLDHAMDAVMAITLAATTLGDRAGLLAFSSAARIGVPPRGDRGQLARVTRAMFTLEPDLTESAYEDVFGLAVARQRRRSLLVVLTELSSEALAETLVPALPLLLARHLVIVGSVQDPEVEQWRTASPFDVDEAYRGAGAVTLRRARDRTGQLLRQTGALVVDAPPGELATRLVDSYLDVKATGRL